MGIEKIIDRIENDTLDSAIKSIEKEMDDLLASESVQKIIQYEDDPPKTREELEDLFSILCWGGLECCCALDKPCTFSRDAVLNALGITPDEYNAYKKECRDLFIEKYWKH